MKKVVTTIEITDTQIKLLQVQKTRQKHVVTFCDVQSVNVETDEDLADYLRRMAARLPLVSDEFICLVPRHFVILRQMTLPSDDYEEIQDMIGLQLINNIPFSIEDVIYQHHKLGRDEKNQSRVLVVIIQKEISQRYCNLLQKAGIKSRRLVLSSFGVQQWVVYQEKTHKLCSSPVMVINIDMRYCEICFCHNKNLFFSRSFPFGGKHLELGETVELMNQIKLSLSMYDKEELGLKPEKIFVLSMGNEGRTLKKCLDKELNIETEVLNPLCGISSAQGVVDKLQVSSSLAAGLGLALFNTENLISLVSVEIQEARRKVEQRNRLLKFTCLIFLAVSLSVSSQLVDIHKKKRTLKILQSQIQNFQDQLLASEEKIQFVKMFDKRLKQLNFIPDIIDQLNHLTPQTVSFQTLSLDKYKNLTIQGHAKTNANVNDFQARLVESPDFHNVDLKFATKRRANNMSIMEFRIASQLGAEKRSR